jgi:hypothetical protein
MHDPEITRNGRENQAPTTIPAHAQQRIAGIGNRTLSRRACPPRKAAKHAIFPAGKPAG